MMWSLLIPTEECPVHEMWPVMPDTGEFQSGHTSGINCPCLPCLDDHVDDSQLNYGDSILFHHVLHEGRPVRCTEPRGHQCVLRKS